MRFLLRIASRSVRLERRAACEARIIVRHRHERRRCAATSSCGLSGRPLVRGADAVVIAASNASTSLVSVARAMRTPCEPPARSKLLAMTRRVVVRDVLFGSRAHDDVTKSQRCEIYVLCIAHVSLLLRWDSKCRLRISRGMSVLDSRSVAIADANLTGSGARKARRLEEENMIFVVAYFTRNKSVDHY